MSDFLSQNAALIASALVAVGTWVYHRAKGDKTDSFTTLIDSFVRQQLADLVRDPDGEAKARDVLERAIWAGLERTHKVDIDNPAPWIRVLVHEGVEAGIAELKHMLLDREDASRAADAMAKAAQGAVDAFTPPPPDKRTIPVLNLDIEEVKPSP